MSTGSTALEVTTNVQRSMNGDNAKDEKLFGESTHQYLIYFPDCWSFLIGAGVVAIQWFLLTILTKEAFDLTKKDMVSVEVHWGEDCHDINQLICSSELEEFGYSILGFVLVAFYVIEDVLASIKAFLTVSGISAKLGSLTILSCAGYTGYTGCLFAYQGYYNGSKYDAIVNCIGVLFVFDIDDKIYAGLKHVTFGDKFKKCCSCLCCSCCDSCFKICCLALCAAIFIIVGIFGAQSMLSASTDIDTAWF